MLYHKNDSRYYTPSLIEMSLGANYQFLIEDYKDYQKWVLIS